MQHSTADHPHDLTLLGSIPRTGRFNLLWSVSTALFLWAIEWAGRDATHRYGLLVNLTYALSLGYWCWTILGMLWLSEARRRWQSMPDAAQRFERSSVYGLIGWPVITAGALLGIPVACLFGVFLAEALLALPWPFQVPPQRPPFAMSLVMCYSLAILTFTIDYLRVRAAANEKRAEAAQRQALRAQLQLLQAQLEPHMLFNTLSNLHALIETDATRAQDMLARLITFLRSTLNASRNPTHPLADEFDHAADYLALMQIRMGARLSVDLDLPHHLCDVQVPPLLIQPLLENAVHHGLEPSRQGGHLSLQAEVESGELVLRVTDTGRGLNAKPLTRHGGNTGFGLSCVRDRLSTLYGNAASLELQPGPGGAGTRATLRLPLPDEPALSATPSTPAPSGLFTFPAP